MTPNKEFVSQTKETLSKMDLAKTPQTNPEDDYFSKSLGIKKDEMVALSFSRSILNAQVSYQFLYGKKNMTINNPWVPGISQLHLNAEVSK